MLPGRAPRRYRARSAASSLGVPTSVSSNKICRCRLVASTRSSSHSTIRPRPASAKASATGQPRPPTPTTSADRCWSASRSGLEVLIQTEIALASVAQHGNDVLALAQLARNLERHRDIGARADARQQALSASQIELGLVGKLIRHGANLGHRARIVVLRHEARGNALDFRRTALTA